MDKKKRVRRRLCGRHLLTLGAVSLLGVSGYELWIRLEDLWAWSAGVRHLSAVRGTPFLEDLGIIFQTPEMRQLGYKLIFLAVTVLFGLICLVRRNRARGAWLLMLLDAAVAGVGVWLGLYSFKPSDWAQTLKLVPLALVMIGCALNLAHRAVARRRRRERRRKEASGAR